MMNAGGNDPWTVWGWCTVFFVIFLFVSVSSAETGEEVSDENEPSFPVAQDNAWEDDPYDDLDFLDEEEEPARYQVADPLRGWNKAMFLFNDKAYFWVMKPVARGYRAVMPEIARKGIRNFFHNIGMPVRFVNCILQGKGRAATGEFGRFMLNSTVGVLGFGNPAGKYPDLNPDAEDLGQTLGRWGIGNGIYLYWPLMGPSTLRDTVGTVGDWFLDPTYYVESTEADITLSAVDNVNALSFRIGEYESLKSAAFDPYTAFRDAYLQYRWEKVQR